MIIAETIMSIVDNYRPMVGINNANLTWEDLALDSLDKMEILIDVEKQCRVKIPEYVAVDIDTPRDMIIVVRNIRNKSNIDHTFRNIKPMGAVMCCVHQTRPTCILDMKPCKNINPDNIKNPYQEVCAQCNCVKFNKFTKTK